MSRYQLADLLTFTLGRVQDCKRAGLITEETYQQYFAIWRYSAPRFVDYYAWPSVSVINARLDALDSLAELHAAIEQPAPMESVPFSLSAPVASGLAWKTPSLFGGRS